MSAAYGLALAAPLLVNFTIIPLVGGHLGDEAAQRLLRALVVGSLLSVPLTLGLPATLTRDIASGAMASAAINRTLRAFSIGIGCMTALTLLVAPAMPRLALLIAIVASAQTAALLVQAVARAERRAWWFLAASLSGFVLSPVLAIIALEATGIERAVLAALAVGIHLPLVLIGQRPSPTPYASQVMWRRLIGDGLPIIPHFFAVMLIVQCFRLYTGWFIDESLVVEYNIVGSLAAGVWTVMSLANQMLAPGFFARDAQRKVQFTSRLSWLGALLSLAGTAAVVAATLVFALFDDALGMLVPAAGLLAAAAVPQTGYMALANYYIDTRRTWILALVSPVSGPLALAIVLVAGASGSLMLASCAPVFAWSAQVAVLRRLGAPADAIDGRARPIGYAVLTAAAVAVAVSALV